jgi:hypothetical protein
VRVALLACCAILAGSGCTAVQQNPSADGIGLTTGSADVEHGVLSLVVDGATTVIEEYTRSERVLEGIVRPHGAGAKFGWARYRVELGPAGDAQRAVLELGRRSDESRPVRTWTVSIGDGEVIETSSDGTIRRVAAARPVVPFFPPSMVMFHEAIRQAHRFRASRGRAGVLVYPMASSGEAHPVTIEWPAPDTAAVSYNSGLPILYAVDTRGRLLGSRGRDGRHVVARLR